MTEQKTEKDFQPITTQTEFDERIKARLARERERWSKESGAGDLQAQLEAKDREIASLKAAHAVDFELAKRGLDKHGKAERIKSQLDFDSKTPVTEQLAALENDVPELFALPRGAGSRGSSTPVLEKEEPLTRGQIEAMSPDEQNQPGMRARINRFLAGERG